MYEYFIDEGYLYIIYEFCAGGILFPKITNTIQYSEAYTASVAKQLFYLLNYFQTIRLECPIISATQIYLVSTDITASIIKIHNPEIQSFINSCLLKPTKQDNLVYF